MSDLNPAAPCLPNKTQKCQENKTTAVCHRAGRKWCGHSGKKQTKTKYEIQVAVQANRCKPGDSGVGPLFTAGEAGGLGVLSLGVWACSEMCSQNRAAPRLSSQSQLPPLVPVILSNLTPKPNHPGHFRKDSKGLLLQPMQGQRRIKKLLG